MKRTLFPGSLAWLLLPAFGLTLWLLRPAPNADPPPSLSSDPSQPPARAQQNQEIHPDSATARTREPAACCQSPNTPKGPPPRPVTAWDRFWTHQPEEPALAGFHDWVHRYQRATDTERAAMVPEGIALAKQRRAALFSLIQQDPERALQRAVPWQVRRTLPGEVVDQLEERISAMGDIEVFGVLPLPGRERETAPIYRVATFGDRRYRMFVYGERESHPTRRQVPLHGVALSEGADRVFAASQDAVRLLEAGEGETLAAAAPGDETCPVSGTKATEGEEPTAVDVGGRVRWLCASMHAPWLNQSLLTAASQPGGGGSEGPLAESPYTEGRKRIVLFRVAFTDVPTPSLTVSAGLTLITNINNYWSRVSYGRITAALPGGGSDVVLVTLTTNSTYYDGDAGRLRGDVRAKATASGVDLSKYDFDITCTGGDPSFSFAGLGYVGGPGAWLANGYFGTATAVHELGHNLGFPHANYWDTGEQSAIGPGGNQEYGDPFDVMGGGGATAGHYVAKFKYQVGWISSTDYPRVTASGAFRVYAQDHTEARGLRGLRVPKDGATDYSLEFRQLYTSNPWLMNGIGLRWGSAGGTSSQLIDTTPGTSSGKDDSAIVIGRTFSDPAAGVHITPVALGHTYPESIDVVVNIGSFPSNRRPTGRIESSTSTVGVSSPITFTAVANDPDGDPLAYHWDFGDNTFGGNTPSATHSWGAAGQYAVRCTVSDMKGGTLSDTVVVVVASPGAFRISGRVMDKGRPLAGVLVTAGSSRYAYTDSDGTYTIPNLSAGGYTLSALLYPYVLAHPWFNNPVTVGPSASKIDFITTDVAIDNVTLVADSAVWKYLDNGSSPGATWPTSAFSDGSWPSGPAQLGYGDGDEATVVNYGPDSNNKYITTYFRHTFTANNLASLTNFNLRLTRDDGGVVYLNGVEVLRDNMPPGTITSTTLAVDNSEGTTLTNIPPNLLLNGQNLIAAEVHQVVPTSSDMSFSLALTATALTNLQNLSLTYIAAPADQAFLADPASVPVNVQAFHSAATYTNVALYVDGTLLAQDTAAPFDFSWSSPARGTHVLSARVQDSAGVTSTSAPVTVHITAPKITQPLVAAGASWRYLDTGTGAPPAWAALEFDDSGWSLGAAELGYGDGGEQTTINGGPLNNRFIASYFRAQFNLEDASLVTNLLLRLVRDDGAVVYLNGAEVFRSNLPEGPISASTLALLAVGGADEAAFNEALLPPSALLSGLNVIAVEVHQNAISSSDLSFNLALEAFLSGPPTPGVKLTSPSPGSSFVVPGPVSLNAAAIAQPGLTITGVEFFDGPTSLGLDATPPYLRSWTANQPGPHVISARAYQSDGSSLTSAIVTVTATLPALPTALVSAGSSWKYLDTGIDPGPAWKEPDFDDSMWPSGAARLGYGGDGELTIVSSGSNPSWRHITTWFRRAFLPPAPAAFQYLRLRLQRDDGVAVHLNGTEVFRSNLRPGLISPNSLAVDDLDGPAESSFLEALIPAALLLPGTNLLAVEIHQASITSTDLGFDLELLGATPTNLLEGLFLTSPAQNSTFNTPAQIDLEAFALAADPVQFVEFFDGATPIGQAAATPYRLLWSNPPEGPHSLTAHATLEGGRVLISPALSVQVGPPPPPILPVLAPVVSSGAAWKYLNDGSNQGTDWRQRDFDDTSWPSGVSRLGYGLDGETTTLPGGVVTAYFRRLFSVASPELIETLSFELQRDDGAVVYLNGQEIFRSNMPPGPPAYNTLASSTVDGLDEQAFVRTVLPTSGSGLVRGLNLLAVELHQASPTSSDAGFDLRVVADGSTDRRVYVGAPAANSSFEAPAQIELEAHARAYTGRSIARVEFFANGLRLGEATGAPPYRFTWNESQIGTYELQAVATDSLGQSFASEPVPVSLGYPPVFTQLIPPTATWRFLDRGTNPGPAWTQLSFSDTNWPFGPARLGYGGDGEETTVSYGPSSTSKYITTYFRHRFQVPTGVYLTNLSFHLQRDDGAVVFLDGLELYRSNMPTGIISVTTLASSSVSDEDEENWFETNLPLDGLHPGDHVVAVEIHQSAANSSDLGFNLELTANGYAGTMPLPALAIELWPNNRVRVTWPKNALGWALFTSTSSEPGTTWTRFPQSPQVTNDLYYILNSRGAGPRLYQLHRD